MDRDISLGSAEWALKSRGGARGGVQDSVGVEPGGVWGVFFGVLVGY